MQTDEARSSSLRAASFFVEYERYLSERTCAWFYRLERAAGYKVTMRAVDEPDQIPTDVELLDATTS